MAERQAPQIYSIAAHRGFADALVAGLVPRYSEPDFGLARLTLLLPSRRTMRTVSEAFIRHFGAQEGVKGLLMPRMAVVGDLDLDETLGPLFDPLGTPSAIPPAVDPLRSGSRMMDRHVLGDRHYRVAKAVRDHLARYRELEDIITMLGIEELSDSDRRVVHRARRLQRYLTQPFHVMTQHTGIAGASVPLDDLLADCEAFLSGQYDGLDEADCYMRGAIRR